MTRKNKTSRTFLVSGRQAPPTPPFFVSMRNKGFTRGDQYQASASQVPVAKTPHPIIDKISIPCQSILADPGQRLWYRLYLRAMLAPIETVPSKPSLAHPPRYCEL